MKSGATRRVWLSVRPHFRWHVITTLYLFLLPVASGILTWSMRDVKHGIWLACGILFVFGVVLAVINVRRVTADAPDTAKPVEVPPDKSVFVPSREVAANLEGLDLFQLSVMVLLLRYGSLTAENLAYRLDQNGFPMGGREEISGATFEGIAEFRPSLIEEKRPGSWAVLDPQSVFELLPEFLKSQSVGQERD